MRAWVVSVGLLSFGAIMIAGGVAHRGVADDWLACQLSITVGGVFMLLGVVAAVFGRANDVLASFPKEDSGKAMRFGVVLILAGLAVTSYAIVDQFVVQSSPPEGASPWVKWVGTAGSIFVVGAGVALMDSARLTLHADVNSRR
jgi:hypothetical protein